MNLRSRLIKALTNKKLGSALADAITAAQAVAPITAPTTLRTDTLANLAADSTTRFAALEAKVNALIAADDLIIL
ncbi:MAG: hypothetical protein ACJ75S_06770 [Solirubrobacterales bacterium]|jgi:hypothetical protein